MSITAADEDVAFLRAAAAATTCSPWFPGAILVQSDPAEERQLREHRTSQRVGENPGSGRGAGRVVEHQQQYVLDDQRLVLHGGRPPNPHDAAAAGSTASTPMGEVAPNTSAQADTSGCGQRDRSGHLARSSVPGTARSSTSVRRRTSSWAGL